MLLNLKIVPRVIFGRGCFKQTNEIISSKRIGNNSIFIFLIDKVFKDSKLAEQIPIKNKDLLIWTDVTYEPKTTYVDELTKKIKEYIEIDKKKNIAGIVGMGGGSTLDLTKAISVMLKNDGPSSQYQGWDLVKTPGIYHIGIPTLSGTGAEVSRTCVLTGPEKKLGINSDYTVFNQIILDPNLLDNVPQKQRFYTGMDCYIHCVEALNGTFLNEFSKAYGEKALKLCRKIFLSENKNNNDKLMIASFFGGMSIAYSQVGICHAMSYGLSFVTGIPHGLGNCLIFNILEEFYPDQVIEFHNMVNYQKITLPRPNLVNMSKNKIEKMIDVSLSLIPLWENALGKNWKKYATRKKLRNLYFKI